MISQKTVAALERLLNVLLTQYERRTLPIIGKEEFRRRLYAAEMPQYLLELIRDDHNWKTASYLPALFEGWLPAKVDRYDGVGDPVPNDEDKKRGRLWILTICEVALQEGLKLPDYLPQRPYADTLLASLQLDGYEFLEGNLTDSTLKSINVSEERDYLSGLLKQINPPNLEEIVHHFKEADKAYREGLWGASSSETRSFFTSVLRGLREIATAKKAAPYFQVLCGDKVLLDNYENEKLLTPEEKEAVLRVWVLLGCSGPHPGIQEQDRAKLARLLVLGMAEWLCIRCAAWKP